MKKLILAFFSVSLLRAIPACKDSKKGYKKVHRKSTNKKKAEKDAKKVVVKKKKAPKKVKVQAITKKVVKPTIGKGKKKDKELVCNVVGPEFTWDV